MSALENQEEDDFADMSISSNIYINKKNQKGGEQVPQNNQVKHNEVRNSQFADLVQKHRGLNKKKSTTTQDEESNEYSNKNYLNFPKEREKQKENQIKNFRDTTPTEVEILHNRVNQLQKNHALMEQKFIKSIKILQEDIAKRDQRNKNMRYEIQTIKADLKDRRSDINSLMDMLRKANQANLISQYNYQPPERHLGSIERDKLSSEKQKKAGSGFKDKKRIILPPSRRSPAAKQKGTTKLNGFINKF